MNDVNDVNDVNDGSAHDNDRQLVWCARFCKSVDGGSTTVCNFIYFHERSGLDIWL